MQSVQRHFGKYMKRTADEQQVSVLLKDFEDADRLLTKIIETSKQWRDSWISILTHQHRLMDEFEILYNPIIGAGDDYHGHVPVQTPDHLVRRTHRIREEYAELKKDLTEDLGQVEEKLIRPAQEAKDNLHMMKKTIKKREDRKLDFERYQSRVDSSLKKTKRSERDNAALAKSQADLATATEAYSAADEHLRNCLPRLLTSVFSLLPHFLAAQIHIQNNLLGHYYTMLHAYCTEEGFPSPSPPMDEVIRLWSDAFKPVQHEAESLMLLASGKAVRTPMNQENGHHPVNGYRRPSANSTFNRAQSVSPARALPPSPSYDIKPKTSTSPSAMSLLSPQEVLPSPSPSHSLYQTPMSYSPAGPHTDYFSRDRQPSTASIGSTATTASIAQKKRPPPPPPPRIPSQQTIFVTALYDFEGQGEGDLVFREGDRIKVLKKTDSTDDWWQGELRGVKGAFPANYCR
ncbi:uncharacterized protein Z518_01582 [Rhinocladiella mackenziei CBS 650.93]|uniref:SH3 domain-containing protein n=1 Tax=Rhinocladiella mackenziei CBS 650.93 TaxID=1442369 RepID=A0A0D2IWZ8_9EURO|nr:uncharacterized protein Z518_01582 [Rhinocladiella mackenziei CBS 650.93]KIX10499.1 hypothetical protein Z518_01582 [Rhinocladiella mackenziei CBS 650.93]